MTVLNGLVPEGELKALGVTRLFTPRKRAAITLAGLGKTQAESARLLHLQPTTLASSILSLAKELKCASRVSAVVHAAYSHPDFPLPQQEGPAPKQDLDEYTSMMLTAHTEGVTVTRLSKTTGIGMAQLAIFNRQLYHQLGAHNPPHAVRLAWRAGWLTRASDDTAVEVR
ncbi:hypothetical protein [Streptomyces klenkii]|uniref:hypothetical protein n=1 Tax=Streptomyces klenkii TaxID=1420899 RepID=UPI003412D244